MADGRNVEQTNYRPVIDQVGRIENYGVDYIPEDQRFSKPINMLWILFGGSMTYGIIVIGWIPVSLGLGWWAAISAVIVGSIIGSTLLAPMSLFGVRTGTNNPVSSGAHFGAKGRLIGSILGITADLVFAALCIWAAGEVLAGSAARLFGYEGSILVLNLIAYTLVAIVMTIVSVLGHANMVSFTKWMVPTAGLIMIVGLWIYWPNFDPNYAGGDYALGSFWPTWILGMVSVAATTQSYGPYVGDWTRHISPKKYSDRKLMLCTWIGGFFGMGGAYAFGAFTAVTFANPTASHASEMVANSPTWYLLPLLYMALVPGTAQAVINIYNMGLDFSSIFTRFTRVQATILLSAVSTILVYIGTFYQQVAVLVSSYLGFLIVLGAPWVTVNIIAFINRKGYYDPQHLQVFNRGEVGGRYWFHNGLNYRAVTAWATAVLVGILFVNTGWYVGPGAKLLSGTDIGLFVSIFTAAIIYIVILYLFPEPHYVFGPEGARFKSINQGDYPPVMKQKDPQAYQEEERGVGA
jgi:purine-cytosine permease-like protein